MQYGYPVELQSDIPRSLITPLIGATSVGWVLVGASLSGTTQVGTMDTTPTEAEVLALQQIFAFDAEDNVKAVVLTYIAGKPASAAALAVHVVVNASDANAAAQALAAGYPGVIAIVPNTPTRVTSSDPITSVTICAVPSSITSANHEGERFYISGISYNT